MSLPPGAQGSTSLVGGDDSHTQADRAFHEATAHVYDPILLPIFGVYYASTIRRILDALAAEAPGREALDLGCGTGGVTVELAERGFRVRGIDHSAAMLELAERKVRERGAAGNVELLTGDVRSLPFPDGEFDVVTCQGVLHHLTDLNAPVREISRVLRPGGLFYIAEPCEGSTPAHRAWMRAMTISSRLRSRVEGARERLEPVEAPVEIPPHGEGPVSSARLLSLLDHSLLIPRVEYSSRFDGIERLPRRLQAAHHRRDVASVAAAYGKPPLRLRPQERRHFRRGRFLTRASRRPRHGPVGTAACGLGPVAAERTAGLWGCARPFPLG